MLKHVFGPQNGKLAVIVGPAGSGKTTLAAMLVRAGIGDQQITCTTRSPRLGEVHGKDYLFLSREQFAQHLAQGFFLEHAEVHGHFYGTPKQPVLNKLEVGKNVILAIDVQGLRQVKMHSEALVRESLVSMFIYSGLQTVRRRLLARAQLSGKPIDPDEFRARLATAEGEIKCFRECDVVVPNDADGPEHLQNALVLLKRAICPKSPSAERLVSSRPWNQERPGAYARA